MAYQVLVKDWNQGVLALEKGNLATALDIFQGIKNPPSKIDFNVGCLYLQQGNLDQALEAFDQTLSKDNCLAVGFFQRGYVHLQLGRYEEALRDGKLAWRCLRNNPCINYKPLGLAFVLRASEVLHNVAAAHCRLGKWHEARETLEEAAAQVPERQTGAALKQVEDCLFLEAHRVPPGKIFRPPLQAEKYKEKDYLGPSKVRLTFRDDKKKIEFILMVLELVLSNHVQMVCQSLPSITAAFFNLEHLKMGGLQLLDYPSQPWELRFTHLQPSLTAFIHHGWLGVASISAGQESSWLPQKLKAGRISRLLGRHSADKNASLFLQKIFQGIPPPPEMTPPSLLHENQKIWRPGQTQDDHHWAGIARGFLLSPQSPVVPTKDGFSLKIHGSFVVNRTINQVPSLAELRAILQEEYLRQAATMKVRYKAPGSNDFIAINNDGELMALCEVQSTKLTLWCQQRSYTSDAPEDLNFKDGDVLEVLSEVNGEWLEGRCNGRTGIFPKLFAEPVSPGATRL
ncbi:LOW QUALITY PROTEIN: NADPH oxidase activator 1 [Vipera latastei]